MRYSLRMLLGVTTLLAVGLAMWAAYRRATLCQMQWFDPQSAEARALIREPEVTSHAEKTGWRFGLRYYTQRKTARLLAHEAHPRLFAATGGWEMHHTGEMISVFMDDRAAAEHCLMELIRADKLLPKSVAVRGRVIDRSGNTVPSAIITIYDAAGNDEQYHAREDGTFTIILPGDSKIVVPGTRYRLRVQTGASAKHPGGPWFSSVFGLDLQQAEYVVVVTVPRR